MPQTETTSLKDTWPRGEHGTVDWEAVFERPPDGLVCLLGAANTERKAMDCTRAIVESLFTRQSDQPVRDEYLTIIESLGDDSVGDTPGSTVHQSVVNLLREIKDDRVERSRAYIDQKNAQAELDAADPADHRRGGDAEGESGEIAGEIEGETPPFSIAVARMIEDRLKVLRCHRETGTPDGKPVPFLVSKEFSDHLKEIIIREIAPDMGQRVRSLCTRAEQLPEIHRVQFILDAFEHRKQREAAWEHWQTSWAQLTKQTELPKKPKDQKKSLGGLLNRKPEKKGWKTEMTLEEWEIACADIEKMNARADRVWSDIARQSDTYQAPDDEDNALLMNLFARTPDTMKKQIRAISQFSEQSGNKVKVFADYQQGKNIDTALLAACYQSPKILLEGGVLKEFMRSFRDTMRRERFPLIERYLTAYI